MDHVQNTIQNVFARLFGGNGSVHSKSQVGVCEAYVKVWISGELRNDFWEEWFVAANDDSSKFQIPFETCLDGSLDDFDVGSRKGHL